MATGYTYPVEDGTVTNFKEFALNCSRAFGARVTERENAPDAKFKPRLVSTYDSDVLVETINKLNWYLECSDEEWLRKHEEFYEGVDKRNAELGAQNKVYRERYQAMLDKVEAWEPPTEDHIKFKQFMVEQLTDSMGVLGIPRNEKRMSVEEFKQVILDNEFRYARNVAERVAEDIKSSESSYRWMKALLESL